MKAVPTTTQNADERYVSEYSKITSYECSTRSCYLELYSATENSLYESQRFTALSCCLFFTFVMHACIYYVILQFII